MALVVAYVRAMDDQEAKFQESRVRRLADKSEMVIDEVLVDVGVSSKGFRSPGVLRLMRLIDQRRVESLFIDQLDCIVDSRADVHRLLRRLHRLGITLTTNERVWLTGDLEDGQFEQALISGMEAVAHLVEPVEPINDGGDRRRSEGLPPEPEFGFQSTQEGDVIEAPNEQRILRLLEGLRGAGLSTLGIGTELKKRGFLSGDGSVGWHDDYTQSLDPKSLALHLADRNLVKVYSDKLDRLGEAIDALMPRRRAALKEVSADLDRRSRKTAPKPTPEPEPEPEID